MKALNHNHLIKRISSVCNHKQTGLHEPVFTNDEIKSVNKSLHSSMVSTSGGMVHEFEKNVKKYVNSKHCIATINGTAALHISLLIVGVKKDDEVLVPPFSFVSTANSILYCNAIPHFIDVNKNNLGVDTEKLYLYLKSICKKKKGISYNKKTGNVIRAIMPVHVFGHAVEMKKLMDSKTLPDTNSDCESCNDLSAGKHISKLEDLSLQIESLLTLATTAKKSEIKNLKKKINDLEKEKEKLNN